MRTAQRVMPGAPRSNTAVVAKLLLDQLLMAPAGTALFFYGYRVRRVRVGRRGGGRGGLQLPRACLSTAALRVATDVPAGACPHPAPLLQLLEGGSTADARASVRERFGPTMMANYVFWPAANIVNFKFVPPEQRILYINIVAVRARPGRACCAWTVAA